MQIKVNLIDFGCCERIIDSNGKHVAESKWTQFNGNLLYTSLNSCNYISRTRRDDLESAFYVILFLLNGRFL